MLAILGVSASAEARVPPSQDPFYHYDGGTPLEDIAPGTVLKTRTIPYHVLGFPLPVKTTQLLYRSTGQIGQATVNVTSIVEPAFNFGRKKLVSYQSYYDTLNPDDEPSYAISGGLTFGGLIPNVESILISPLLSKGYTIVIPDTQGQQANLAAGHEYAFNTLDSVRATFNSPAVGLPADTKVVLIGFSGGAIATEWAAELAPSYAPDVDKRVIGYSMGGVFVHPMHNLHYVDGSLGWSGLVPAALVGIFRSYGLDPTPYLNDHGKLLVDRIQKASILNLLFQYPGLTWESIAKPEYAQAEKIPVLVEILNDLIMGTGGGTPSAPMLIRQNAGGEAEGSRGDKPGIGLGDGVMIAGDVRSLARDYCARGVEIEYRENRLLSHIPSTIAWSVETIPWVEDRFANRPVVNDCAQIQPGNSLAPTPAP